MTRLLWAGGDPRLATRTLRLYAQVVGKASETLRAERDDPKVPSTDGLGVGAGVDTDTDQNWVMTLVHGSRMLCRLALQERDYGDALDLAKEAGDMLEKAKTRLNSGHTEIRASLQLARGIWNSVMAHTGS